MTSGKEAGRVTKCLIAALGLFHSYIVTRHVTSTRAIVLTLVSKWKLKEKVIWLLYLCNTKFHWSIHSYDDIYDASKVSSSFFQRVCKTWQVSCTLVEYIWCLVQFLQVVWRECTNSLHPLMELQLLLIPLWKIKEIQGLHLESNKQQVPYVVLAILMRRILR